MATLGYLGFTINITKREDGNKNDVLIWAGGGTEAVSREKLEQELDSLLHNAIEDNKFLHWKEVWDK